VEGDRSFWASVSLDTAADGSARLALGSKNYAASDFGGAGNRQGAVYLYTFTGTNSLNNSFDGGSLAAIIGESVSSANAPIFLDIDMDVRDHFGISVSLDGTMLAVGKHNDDGVSDTTTNTGAVYLFTFDDTSFTNLTHVGTIGDGYTGGKNINESGLDNSDWFGHGVSLDDNRLAVLAYGDDGLSTDEVAGNGAVYLYTFSDSSFSDGTKVATIGANYSGTKDINFEIGAGFNTDTENAMSSVALDGTNLAIGAMDGDGATLNKSGEVYIFSFTDSSFSGGALEATIGEGRAPSTPYISAWGSTRL
jgi:hypothetical protein